MKSIKDRVLVSAFAFFLLLFIIPLPPLTGIRSCLYSMMFGGGVTYFVVTPSGDRFGLESDGSFSAACPQTYNYELSLYHTSEFDTSVYKHNWYRGLYVRNASRYRVVKDCIVGHTKAGYFIINTAKRHVYVNLELLECRKMLTQMGVPADIL